MYSGSDSGYCDTPEPSSNDLQCPTSIVETTMEDKIKDCLMSGPSCRALRHAVMGLNRLDDFSCEHIGNGFYSKVYKVCFHMFHVFSSIFVGLHLALTPLLR